jgi:hypothetical protein
VHTDAVDRDLRAEFEARRRRGPVALDDETRQVIVEIIRTRSLDEVSDRLAAEDLAAEDPEHFGQ